MGRFELNVDGTGSRTTGRVATPGHVVRPPTCSQLKDQRLIAHFIGFRLVSPSSPGALGPDPSTYSSGTSQSRRTGDSDSRQREDFEKEGSYQVGQKKNGITIENRRFTQYPPSWVSGVDESQGVSPEGRGSSEIV